MKKKSRLDKVLLILGYVAAAFILVAALIGIIIAIIKMSKNGEIPPELPQAQAEAGPMLIPERKPSTRKSVKARDKIVRVSVQTNERKEEVC